MRRRGTWGLSGGSLRWALGAGRWALDGRERRGFEVIIRCLRSQLGLKVSVGEADVAAADSQVALPVQKLRRSKQGPKKEIKSKGGSWNPRLARWLSKLT